MKVMPEGGRPVGRLLRFTLLVIGALALAFGLLAVVNRQRHEGVLARAGWMSDYWQVRASIEKRYANLEWTVEKRQLDLVGLNRETVRRLEHAVTQTEAERALGDFIKAFGDRHMSLRKPKKPDYEQWKLKVDLLSRTTPPENACTTLGYAGWVDDSLPFDLQGLVPFRPLDDASAFSAVTVTIAGRQVGLVRIPSFFEDDYGSTCRHEWTRWRATLESTCEDACRSDFRLAVRNRLIEQFEARIRQFRSPGVSLLVLDLTGNRGGYSWYRPIGRMLARGEDPPPASVSLVRGPDAVATIEAQLLRLDRGLAVCVPSGAQRRVIEERYRGLESARVEAMAPCDRRAIWSARASSLACSQLTSAIDLPKDAIAHLNLEPESPRRSDLRAALPQYRQAHTVWTKRVAVLIDENTGSAAELLTGILQDYGEAVIIGHHSSGSGAGWAVGRRTETLPNTGLELRLPDSVAYRRDGSNCRAGVEPDISTGWKPDDDPRDMGIRLVRSVRRLEF